jgi:hypothetical protein
MLARPERSALPALAVTAAIAADPRLSGMPTSADVTQVSGMLSAARLTGVTAARTAIRIQPARGCCVLRWHLFPMPTAHKPASRPILLTASLATANALVGTWALLLIHGFIL